MQDFYHVYSLVLLELIDIDFRWFEERMQKPQNQKNSTQNRNESK